MHSLTNLERLSFIFPYFAFMKNSGFCLTRARVTPPRVQKMLNYCKTNGMLILVIR